MTPPADWPASAGPAPEQAPAEYRDPRPRHYDPPPGLYRLPDGTLRQLDPPPGHYDPQPGYYPATASDAATGVSLGPLPRLVDTVALWQERRRRLRIGLAVSGGFLGAGIVGTSLSLAFPNDCGARRGEQVYFNCEAWPIGLFVWAFAVIPASAIATIVYGVRLGKHEQRRPQQLQRAQLTPGGLLLRF